MVRIYFLFFIFSDRRLPKKENETTTENYDHRSPIDGTRIPRSQVYIETNPGWLELPLTRTNFHGTKPVPATEVPL